MRLRRFEIKNFKSIEYLAFDWKDLIVLIGENNTGKSSVLHALSWFLSGSAIKDQSLYRRHQAGPNDAIELIGYFDQLSDRDKNQVAVKGRMHNDEWILKKQFWFEEGTPEDQDRSGWKEQLYSYSTRETFANWPEPDNSWSTFSPDYQPLIQQIPNRPNRPNAVAREALREIVRQQRSDLVVQSAPEWIPNPGGGGNWKSNANSIIPRVIYVRAVHEATDETNTKDASTYGKLINLIVERSLSKRQEMQQLRSAIEAVLELFRPDEAHPEKQAEEIRFLQDRINQGLSDVIGGQAVIKTDPPELGSLVLPSTALVIRDPLAGIETQVTHQGHGLQRTLIMTLLQLLTEAQEQAGVDVEAASVEARPSILMIEEPELYMHPQMERRMRDVLYKLAGQTNTQVICCTHSPVFLDIANKYQSIVRLVKQGDGKVIGYQVTQDLFAGHLDAIEKQRLQAVARFNPTVNELFFARQVVLLEEFSAIVAFERAGEITGLFARHPHVRRGVCLIDCAGKDSIPGFQRVLNRFNIAYRVIHDADAGNSAEVATNEKIAAEAANNPVAVVYTLAVDLESLLGFRAPSKQKPLRAYRRIEELNQQSAISPKFIEAVNMVYFGSPNEPSAA